jgi:hypothetical protein
MAIILLAIAWTQRDQMLGALGRPVASCRAARPGRGTSAPVETIERRGSLSQSLGFHHAQFRAAGAEPSA